MKAGEDTRPGTDAELMMAISHASQRTPLHGAVVTLQMRMFKRRLPELFEQLDVDFDSHEQVHGDEADEWERRLRREQAQPDRVLS